MTSFSPHIAVFLTYGGSLSIWEGAGILSRELSLYEGLAKQGVRVSLVSYADSSDRRFLGSAHEKSGIRLLTRPDFLPMRVYAHSIGLVHRGSLSDADVFKTNQVFGAKEALMAARFLKKPVITRMGFHRLSYRPGEDMSQGDAFRQMEREWPVFRDSAHIIVPTESIRRNLGVLYGTPPEKVSVVPNFVDVSRVPFSGGRDFSSLTRFLTVGRLTEQKNIGALILALEPGQSLTVIGEGEDRAALESLAARTGKSVTFRGRQGHAEVIGAMASHDLFVLPSRYEGLPKVVIEAMACGIPVLASDAPGTRDVVRHGENGFLCGLSPREISAGIAHVLSARADLPDLVQRARMEAETRYDLSSIITLERRVYDTVLEQQQVEEKHA